MEIYELMFTKKHLTLYELNTSGREMKLCILWDDSQWVDLI